MAVIKGAMMQKAAAALPVKVAASMEATVKPSITLVMLPLAMALTLFPINFTAWVRLNPSETTNMLRTITTLLLERLASAS